MNKMTRQGVRDLSHIKGPSVGKTLEAPPTHQLCDHKRRKKDDYYGNTVCQECGVMWDWSGKEW